MKKSIGNFKTKQNKKTFEIETRNLKLNYKIKIKGYD
jgi:hypothetical protein